MEGFPEHYDLFPRLSRIGRAVGHALRPAMTHTLSTHGNHFTGPRGASEQLDAAMYEEQPQLWDEANVTAIYPQAWGSEGEWVGDEGA